MEPLNTILQNLIKKYDNSGKIRVLDVGCANLRDYALKLIDHSFNYTGIDIDEQNIEKASNKVKNKKNCQIIFMNAEQIRKFENEFDVIFCNNMLAYTDQILVLNSIYKNLKNDGYCFSYYNNTLSYSIYKIFHPMKPFLIELIHSIIVILNTFFYDLIGIKFFHTTYNTKKKLENLIKQIPFKEFGIEVDRTSFPYSVIHLYFIK